MIAADNLPGYRREYSLIDKIDDYEDMARSLVYRHAVQVTNYEQAIRDISMIFTEADKNAYAFELTDNVHVSPEYVSKALTSMNFRDTIAAGLFLESLGNVLEDWQRESEQDARTRIPGQRYQYTYSREAIQQIMSKVNKSIDEQNQADGGNRQHIDINILPLTQEAVSSWTRRIRRTKRKRPRTYHMRLRRGLRVARRYRTTGTQSSTPGWVSCRS